MRNWVVLMRMTTGAFGRETQKCFAESRHAVGNVFNTALFVHDAAFLRLLMIAVKTGGYQLVFGRIFE